MSREIKFRAWEKTLKEIIPVHSIDFDNKIINSLSVWRFLDEVELMQFTGLHDKNGTPIYEGDILDTHAQFDDIYIRTVIYKDCGLDLEPGTGFTLTKGNEKHFEVIGNIYQNEDLLP